MDTGAIDPFIGLSRFPPIGQDFLKIHRIIFPKRIDTTILVRA
jgi:hypothetical protein